MVNAVIIEKLKALTLNFESSYSVKVCDVSNLGVPVYVHPEEFRFITSLITHSLPSIKHSHCP